MKSKKLSGRPTSRRRVRRNLLRILCAALLIAMNSWFAPINRPPFEGAPVLPGMVEDNAEDIEGREEWFRFQRTYPRNTIPIDARLRAWEGTGRGKAPKLAAFAVAPRWRSIGPSPTSSFYGSNWGFTSGRINSVAVSPANSNLVLIGSSTGGIWRSTNRGSGFAPVTDDQVDLAVGSITFSRSEPSIVYAGMGDRALGYLGSGVLKSLDGGATWQRVNNKSLPTPGTISKIEVDPVNSNRVYVAQYTQLSGNEVTSSGFYLSMDGGVSWNKTLTGRARDIAIDPSNRQTLYLGTIRGDEEEETENSPSGLYRSLDGGNSWTLLLASPNDDAQTRDVRVAIAPTRPQTIYVYTGANGSIGVRLLVSHDGGTTWADLGSGGIDTGQFGYNTYIAVDPNDADTIYLGSRDVYRSTNGGLSWINLTRNFSPGVNFYHYTPAISNTHPDQHALAFGSNSNEIYISNDGGISKTTDGGNTFQALNSSLSLTQFISIAIHPTDPQIGYGGTQDNGTQRRLPNSEQWREFSTGDGGRCVINPTNPSQVFVTYIRGAVFRYAGDGKFFDNQIAWNSSFNEPDNSPRIAFYPPFTGNGVDSTLYFGTWRLFKSNNLGPPWSAPGGETDLTKGVNDNGRDVLTAIGVGPSNVNVIYTGSAQGRAMVSTDGGVNWTDVTEGLPDRFITSITVDSADSASAYLTVSGFESGHIFKTTDTGATWTDISNNLPDIPVNALLIDPISPSIIYAGTDIGVFRTSTGGAEWYDFNKGLPPAIIQAFAAQPSGLIHLATYGRGAYELTGDPRPAISSADFDGKKKINISGSGFGDNARVLINGVDRSSRIKSASDTEIRLKGKIKKLGLEPGENTIQVVDSTQAKSNVVKVVL